MTTISIDLGDALGTVRSTPRRRRWAKLGRDDQARRNSNEGCQTNHDKEGLKLDSIKNDAKLRVALHSVYVALFEARKTCPSAFSQGDLTRIITGLMGSRPWSWRVIGITPEALKLFKEHEFKKPPRMIQRGHRQDRASTARELFSSSEPMPLDDFYEFFLERDQTVLMTAEQNKHRPNAEFPPYIDVEQSEQLFPSGTLIGYQHRKQEVAYLRRLYEEHLNQESK